MLGDVRNLKTSKIALRERLPTLECEWLVGRLRSRRGVAAAQCNDARHLMVEYDADEVVTDDLIDFLNQCGVRAAAHAPLIAW
jgi:hypothetical protein